MNKSEMMRKAHRITRSSLLIGDCYAVNFSAALRMVWDEVKEAAAMASITLTSTTPSSVVKEYRVAELRSQIEALRTMPAGSEMPDGREMSERRRARYVQEASDCLEEAEKSSPESLYGSFGWRKQYIFADMLMKL